MRKFAFVCILITLGCLLSMEACAKSTYIPKYNNRLEIKVGEDVASKESSASFLTLGLEGDDVSFTIVQQVVTSDLVKAIKAAKSAAGWSAVAAGLNAFVAVTDRITNQSPYVTYRYADAVANTSIALSNAYRATEASDELKDLPISFVVQNNSDKEIVMNDMDRGLMWFVQPNLTITIPLDNGASLHFRVSSTALNESPIRYVTAEASNEMRKYQNLAYEDDSIWIVENVQSYNDPVAGLRTKSVGYEKIDKVSAERTYYSIDEGKALVKSLKK